MKFLISILILLFSTGYLRAQDVTKYVNTFIGTGGHGHTYPGAVMPHGMVQLSPDTRLDGWDGCGGYHYSDDYIFGFTHTHLSGTGVSDYGDILLMPFTGMPSPDNKIYGARFSHKNENAAPGYYHVDLENGVGVDLTVTARTGMHRYSFPAGAENRVMLDLKHRDEVLASEIKIVDSTTITGMRNSRGWADNQYVFFAIRFSRGIINYGLWDNDSLLPVRVTSFNSKNAKGWFRLRESSGSPLLVKIGISSVSIQGALKNLEAENEDWNFDEVKNKAHREWQKELGKVQVTDEDDNKKSIFYSALYHTAIVPNINMDIDGQYRGRDNKIHTASGFTNYSVFSLWDTYRATHPLYTITDRKRSLDYIKSFLAQYEDGGKLPVWELSSCETECMIGYHSVPVIVDAYMKGIKAFNTSLALEAMKKSATWRHYGLQPYMKKHMIESGDEQESVSRTLEYAYDDWCIAIFARALSRREDFSEYILRAQYYKNMLEPKTAFMRPRYNGGWLQPFDPREVNNNFTEANSWQYSFYMPQDISGYMQLTRGKLGLEKKLDELFSADSRTTGREQSDITGLIGQYAHGNEPSHHIAYLYDYASAPYKTQEKVHRIMNDMYQNAPDGLSGNEDCGQMSAWYVFSALGFYPVTPGQPQYAIGTPQFRSVTLKLENGKSFTIQKSGSKDDFYIRGATYNGKPYTKAYLAHDDIMRGGQLKFMMNDKPMAWGIVQPPSSVIAAGKFVINPVINGGAITFRRNKIISLEHPDPSVQLYYTLDGNIKGPGFRRYNKPFQTDSSINILAVAIDSKGNRSAVVPAIFKKLPHDWKVMYTLPYEQQYSSGGEEGLVDGLYGTTDWRRGLWQGFQGNDADIIIDLGDAREVSVIKANFLQDSRAWIVMPSQVQFFSSEDGKTFKEIYTGKNFMPFENETATVMPVAVSLKNLKARYIRVLAKQYGKLPAWHPGAGGDSHIFMDEIEIR
ncbi:MAG: GH92 family glycosyl hydrolase [Ferruginibacter sp.]